VKASERHSNAPKAAFASPIDDLRRARGHPTGEAPPIGAARRRYRVATTAVACIATILAIIAAASPGCGSPSIALTPAEAASAYTPEQAAALDIGLTASIKLQLLLDSQVRGWRINVDTRDRVVVLKGVTETAAEKARAARIAWDTHGVSDVIDQLTIRTPEEI
jgi:hypothetical protein